MSETISLDLVNLNNRLYSGAIELSDGEEFTITGSGFGTKAGYFDFFDQSPIMTDSSTYPLGSTFDQVGRWSGTNFVGASNRPIISNEGINGKKCLKWSSPSGGNNCLQYYYDSPLSVGTSLYFTRWVKHRVIGTTVTGGQWKSDRWMALTNSLSDKANETYKNIYTIVATDNKIQVRDDSGAEGVTSKVLSANDSAATPILKNVWIRNDVKITLPTSYSDRASYSHEEWVYDPNGINPPAYYLFTNNQAVDLASPYTSDASRWNMHLMQNYLGSGGGGDFTSLGHDLWYSKVAEMVGDDKRIEFGSTRNDIRSPRSFIASINSWGSSSVSGKIDAGDLTFGWLKLISGNTILRAIPVRIR